jgi:hypothetical protein
MKNTNIILACIIYCNNSSALFFPPAQRAHVTKCTEEYKVLMEKHNKNYQKTLLATSRLATKNLRELYALHAQKKLAYNIQCTEVAFSLCLNAYQNNR